jgi:hypothetical protein
LTPNGSGASFWGVSAAVKGGFAAESKDDSVAATSAKQQTMHIAYKVRSPVHVRISVDHN